MARIDTDPSRYVMRVDRGTGCELSAPIDPGELLIRAHRDHHPVDLAMQFLASRFVELTGSEWLVKRGLSGVRTIAEGLAGGVGFASRSRGVERAVRGLLGVGARPRYSSCCQPCVRYWRK